MKKTLPWHHSLPGTIILWVGSIEVAVPVLTLTAAALAFGTYLDSTQGAKVARGFVYGSWWFMALMALVCVSLTFAVMTRYPWKRRHLGFITVHASLIALIAGGFWSLVGRVEGHLGLEEGKSGSSIETPEEQLQVLEHQTGEFTTLGTTTAPERPTMLTLAGLRVQVVERWDNVREEEFVSDDGVEPFRAVQVSPQQGAEAVWVGQEDKAGGASVIGGLRVRVLADGAGWEPPTQPEPAAQAGFAFIVGNQKFLLRDEGQEVLPGWMITSVKRFARAVVSGNGLAEAPSGPENPAVEVSISDGKGTTERHTAFLNFPDMVMNKSLEGAAHSGARLIPTSAGDQPETLIVYGPVASPKFAYVAPDGAARPLADQTGFPRTLDLGARRVTVVLHLARAHGGSKIVKAPPAKDNRPALVFRVGDATELTICAWKAMAPAFSDGRNLMLRFGPRVVPLPFTVRLADFRKTDYPGTEMAMAYESEVGITLPDQPESTFLISMNHPYIHGPWRVFQSGFMGDTLSIFSVMRDPGLPLTYAASALLCVGIVITFFSRSLSWGHPGIPAALPDKEQLHASPPPAPPDPRPAPVGRPVGAGSV